MDAQVISTGYVHSGTRPESTLLVVEDDEQVRRALHRVLHRAPCRVLDASGAETAIRILEREPVQAIVSDHRMPGTTGIELLRSVKERWPRVQRVLLTGQTDSAAIEEAVNRSEIFRFICKPWDDAHLLLTVQSAIDQFWTLEENDRLTRELAGRNAELERMNRELDARLAARQAALLRAAAEWRACFDALGDPVAIVKGGGCEVVRANAAFARAAGVALNGLPGLRCGEHAYGTLPCPSRCRVAAGGVEAEAAYGDRTWLVRSFPFTGEDGAFVVVMKDVTEEREVTQALFHAEKMSAIGQLAGGVAHEINNPLGGILAFAQLMSRDERSADDAENLRLIQDAAMRAKRIVESLLRFSRRPQGDEKGPVDLGKIAEDALFLVGPQLKGGTVEVVRSFEPVTALGNANQLQQIAVNLLVNAIQAVAGSGKITVAVGPAGAGRARLSVADTGPGVRPEHAKRIFEPFFTTKPEGQGTGLGLSICYQIAEEHGGTITLESEPGRGARFVLELPIAHPRAEPNRERGTT